MSSIRDYQKSDAKYHTVCKCNKRIDWVAPFNMPIEDLRELVKKKFNWTILPSRCPKCRGIQPKKK